MNVILLDASEVDDSGYATLTDARAVHMLEVLEVAPGDTVNIGVVDGPRGIATVGATTLGGVTVHCAFDSAPPPRPPIDLLLALPRPKVMRRLWAQLAAIGVGRIMLTNAARVERNYFDTHVLSPGCYRPLLIEGLQQARDTRLPLVSIHRQFRKLIEDDLDLLVGDGHRLVADHRTETSIGDAMRDRTDGRVVLAVGPEGGWNAFELELLQSRGFHPVSLGARTLRVDTACIALLALVGSTLPRANGRRHGGE